MNFYQLSPVAAPEHIASWLQDLDAEDNSGWDAGADFGQGGSEQSTYAKLPTTPPQKRRQLSEVAEISPTDTTFSDLSIFDVTERCLLNQNRKVNSQDKDDYENDSDSSATSTGDSEASLRYYDTDETDKHGQSQGQRSYFESEDLTSFCPLDESARTDRIQLACNDLKKYQRKEDNLVVRLFSCLQCTLKGLRCSRSPPACSRCVRAGYSDLCLLTRRKLVEETNIEVPGDILTPVLLKLADVDEAVWQEKVVLADELLQTWREQKDRNNWILPNPNLSHLAKVSYTYDSRPHLLDHPGEGQGNVGDHITNMRLDLDCGPRGAEIKKPKI